MRRGRSPRGERDILFVPVRPGTSFAPRDEPEPRGSLRRRILPAVLAALALALIGYGIVLLTDSPRESAAPAAPALASTTVQQQATRQTPARPAPTAQELAHTAGLRIAAKLPVTLETAALLRAGGTMYVVGGTRPGGKPTAAILRIDLATGHVRAAGRFIEPLTGAAAAQRGGALFLVGGWTGEKVASAVLRWTPGKEATVVARLPAGVRGASAGFAGGRLYVTGGTLHEVFAVDIGTGDVAAVSALPPTLREPVSNLDYLVDGLTRP